MKVCSRCRRELDESCFTKNKASKDGLMSYCKDCLKQYNDKRKLRAKIEAPEYKVCTKCKERKSINCFNHNANNRDGYSNTCRECSKILMDDYLKRRREKGITNFVYRLQDDSLEQEKNVVCQRCGKEFVIKRSKRTGNFSQQRYCDDCLGKKQTKIIICQKCGKPFEVGRTSDDKNFKTRKYCPDCSTMGKQTRLVKCQICGKDFVVGRNKDGAFYDRKLCYDCYTKSLTSIPEKRFENLLKEHNTSFIREFNINSKYYDFYIENTNIVIEINPSFSHSSSYNGFYKEKACNYHYLKTKNAIENGYVCICIWDWVKYSDVVNLILSNSKLKQTFRGIMMYKYENYVVFDDGYDIEVLPENMV